MSEQVSQLRKAEQQEKLEKKIASFIKHSVLIIDLIGYLSLAKCTLFIISRRYELWSIILISNKGSGELGEMIKDDSNSFKEKHMNTQKQKDGRSFWGILNR